MTRGNAGYLVIGAIVGAASVGTLTYVAPAWLALAPPSDEARRYAERVGVLTREQSDVDRTCREGRVDIDSRKLASLKMLPAAAPATKQYEGELLKAQATRQATERQAKQQFEQKSREVDAARLAKDREADLALREANRKAELARTNALAAARTKYERQRDTIRRKPLSEQGPLLREAEAVYGRDKEDAETTYQGALRQNRDAMQATRRATGSEEQAERDKARDQRQWAEAAATAAHEAERQAAEARLLATLTTLPEAVAVLQTFAHERAEHDRQCAARLDAILAELRRARESLGVAN